MSLARLTLPRGEASPLAGAGPFACEALRPLMGVPFQLPADDPWVEEGGSVAHTYLDAARRAWEDYPDWMDFLDLDSPAWGFKTAARDLYLHHWAPWLDAERVLDVGCGIGRMTHPFLDRGATVHGVDADLESLQRCAWHAAGRAGRLDLHWSTAWHLPDIEPVDVVVAVEVLCYVPEVERALEALLARLRPGGVLLLSVEALHGWTLAADVPPGSLELALTDARVLHLPGDRWVRLYSGEEVTELLTRVGLEVQLLEPTLYVPEGPLERLAPEECTTEDLLRAEAQCKAHPVFRHLNRTWTVVARKPEVRP